MNKYYIKTQALVSYTKKMKKPGYYFKSVEVKI